MSFGKGKYDVQCTELRKSTGADLALAIIIGGDLGNGFSAQTNNINTLDAIPAVLRTLANSIENDIREADAKELKNVHD